MDRQTYHEVMAERAESWGVKGREDALKISDRASLIHGGSYRKQ